MLIKHLLKTKICRKILGRSILCIYRNNMWLLFVFLQGNIFHLTGDRKRTSWKRNDSSSKNYTNILAKLAWAKRSTWSKLSYRIFPVAGYFSKVLKDILLSVRYPERLLGIMATPFAILNDLFNIYVLSPYTKSVVCNYNSLDWLGAELGG